MAEEGSVASEDYVESLRRRLLVLEQAVVGDEAPPEGHPLTSILDSINRRLQILGSKAEAVTKAWAMIPELEAVLKPDYSTSLKQSTEAQEELLLCYAEQLERLDFQVQQLESLKDIVNTSAFRGMEPYNQKIVDLARTHVVQKEEVSVLSKQVKGFADTYKKLLLQISSQCVQWDNTLTQLEATTGRK